LTHTSELVMGCGPDPVLRVTRSELQSIDALLIVVADTGAAAAHVSAANPISLAAFIGDMALLILRRWGGPNTAFIVRIMTDARVGRYAVPATGRH
jgi:hypothetical protein